MSVERLFVLWHWKVRTALLEGGMAWVAAKAITRERTYPLFAMRAEPEMAAAYFLRTATAA